MGSDDQSTIFAHVEIVGSSIQVNFQNGNTIKYEDCWLRDNCRCSSCYLTSTSQRAKHILEIPDSSIAKLNFNKKEIKITWDDHHISSYTPTFLAMYDYKKWTDSRRLKPKLWSGEGVATKVARVQAGEFLKSEEAARRVFQSILDYGAALIEGVEPTLKGTQPVCEALGGVQHTLFGGMWEFTTNPVHADTAYTALGLAAHHDNTYFTEAAGLQVLHCFEHKNGTGGENFLVDGFYGATKLKEEHPEEFEFLTKFNVEAEYLEEGHNHKYSAPVIIADTETGDLVQIRYNVYDRTTMAFESGEKCRLYYRSLRKLGRYYQDTSNQWQFKLNPGTALVMDNFRVLHGRTAFTGSRVIGGSYVSRSDWLDRARVLGLIG